MDNSIYGNVVFVFGTIANDFLPMEAYLNGCLIHQRHEFLVIFFLVLPLRIKENGSGGENPNSSA